MAIILIAFSISSPFELRHNTLFRTRSHPHHDTSLGNRQKRRADHGLVHGIRSTRHSSGVFLRVNQSSKKLHLSHRR